MFATKVGIIVPKIDDVDPSSLRELVWSFATRCHPPLGNVTFVAAPAPPLIAYLRSSEKTSALTSKVVYNCLPPHEWGDALATRSSFAHAYPEEIGRRVLSQCLKGRPTAFS